MNIDAEEYKPKVRGRADFFSWQLYKWLKKKPYYCRVYKGAWNVISGHDPDNPWLYIGLINDGYFSGNLLRRICRHGQRLESWAYCSKTHRVDEWEDVTEWFFSEYEKKGVCAIHGDFAHKWQPLNSNQRICEYCKKVETSSVTFGPKVRWA